MKKIFYSQQLSLLRSFFCEITLNVIWMIPDEELDAEQQFFLLLYKKFCHQLNQRFTFETIHFQFHWYEVFFHKSLSRLYTDYVRMCVNWSTLLGAYKYVHETTMIIEPNNKHHNLNHKYIDTSLEFISTRRCLNQRNGKSIRHSFSKW